MSEKPQVGHAALLLGGDDLKSLLRAALRHAMVPGVAPCARVIRRRPDGGGRSEVTARGYARQYENVLRAAEATVADARLARAELDGMVAFATVLHVADDDDGELTILSVAGTDIDDEGRRWLLHMARAIAAGVERISRLERLGRESRTDYLTGLLNVRGFRELLDHEIGVARRWERSLSTLLIDVDHFKQVNDDYGHAAGDLVLGTVASELPRDLRAIDFLARVGGDELAVGLPGTCLEGALIVAERVRSAMEASRIRMPDGRELSVTLSIGVASLAAPDDGARLMARADLALYEAKVTRNSALAAAEDGTFRGLGSPLGCGEPAPSNH
jgi:diguanylate cyclase (GGDEF)-like protein